MHKFTNVTAAPVVLRRGVSIHPGEVESADFSHLNMYQRIEGAAAIPSLRTLAFDPTVDQATAAKILSNWSVEPTGNARAFLRRVCELALERDFSTMAEAALELAGEEVVDDNREKRAFEMRSAGADYSEIAEAFDVDEATARRMVTRGGE